MQMHIKCTSCGVEKDESSFYSKTPTRKFRACKACCITKTKVYRSKDPKRYMEYDRASDRKCRKSRPPRVNRKKNPERHAWFDLIDRCNNPFNKSYKNYGGRGIRVSKEWMDYSNFIRDMGTRPSAKHSIDRIDVNLGYCKDNCRWATQLQQQRNRRNNVKIEFRGVLITLSEAEEVCGIDQSIIGCRIKKGWPVKEAMETPVRHRPKTTTPTVPSLARRG